MFGDLPYKVVDDFLPIEYWKQINDILCSVNHTWYFQNNVTLLPEHANSNSFGLGCFGFSAWIVRLDRPYEIAKDHGSSCISEMIMPLCFSIQQFVGGKGIIKARCDMTMYNPNNHMHPPHIDIVNTEHIAAVYYVNESDGNTVLYNQRYTGNDYSLFPEQLDILVEVEPKPNRLLVFDGSLIHTGHSPSKNNYRVIINSDYYI